MIYVTSGGEPYTNTAYAVIDVTYPEGSTCTCSNGNRTLKAKNKLGAWCFYLPSAGTWEITITNGAKTKSKNVLISNQGEAVHVGIGYELILFDEQGTKPELGTAFDTYIQTLSGVKYISISTTTYSGYHVSRSVTSDVSIPFGSYSTLFVEYKTSPGTGKIKANTSETALEVASNKTPKSIDISAVSDGTLTLTANPRSDREIGSTLTVYKLWLE